LSFVVPEKEQYDLSKRHTMNNRKRSNSYITKGF